MARDFERYARTVPAFTRLGMMDAASVAFLTPIAFGILLWHLHGSPHIRDPRGVPQLAR
jgi:hypothetical protein